MKVERVRIYEVDLGLAVCIWDDCQVAAIELH